MFWATFTSMLFPSNHALHEWLKEYQFPQNRLEVVVNIQYILSRKMSVYLIHTYLYIFCNIFSTANNDQDSAATATTTTSDSLVEIKSPAQIQLEKVGSIDSTVTIVTLITDMDDYKSILYDWSIT